MILLGCDDSGPGSGAGKNKEKNHEIKQNII